MSKKILLLIAVVIIFLGVFYFFTVYYFPKKESYFKEQEIDQIDKKEQIEQIVTYIINKGEGDVYEYKITEISEDSTIFSLLENLAIKENFEITTIQYDFGIFVESIDEVKNGTNNKYWLYWVNDKLGEVAADKKKVKAGDKIEWKFAPSPF